MHCGEREKRGGEGRRGRWEKKGEGEVGEKGRGRMRGMGRKKTRFSPWRGEFGQVLWCVL